MKQFLVAHRGASGTAAENTRKAFERAYDLGVEFVECDISLSKDGELIVFHDNTLDRLTTAKGWVKDYSLQDLKKLHAENEPIATFSELTDLAKKVDKKVFVEIKGENRESVVQTTKKLAEFIRKNRIQERITVISFWWDAIMQFKKEFPKTQAFLLLCNGISGQKMLEWVKEVGADGVSSESSYLSKEIVDLFHTNNFLVNAWTVNDNTTFNFVKDIGVDYITTNYPDRFKI